MADRVTIRHPETGQERSVAKSVMERFPDFFKGWEVLTPTGRVSANQPAAQKEN